jgi:hypothetical protein
VLGARERDPLAGEDARPVLGEPLQRLDRRQQLHDLRLCARAPLLGAEQLRELVELVDQRLCRARHIPRAIARPERGPERLHGRGLLDGGGDVAWPGDRDGAQPLAGGRAERFELGSGLHRGGEATGGRVSAGACDVALGNEGGRAPSLAT